ncbi:DUF2892 domain-containing protein [Candidatus Altiarchaeota archaeon]
MDLKKLFTEQNVGGWDLFIRSLLGSIAIVALALDLVEPPWTWVLALVALVGLFTSLTLHCTPYGLLGISTKK